MDKALAAPIPPLTMLLQKQHIRSRIDEVLGQRASQFASSLVSIVNANKTLAEAEPNSVLAAAMQAALLDLPINKDLGFAHIIPYKGIAQFQMGYKGFIQLGLRTGQYRNLNACVVCTGELVNYNKLTGEVILEESRKINDIPVGYAAYMELVNGFRHAVYWTVAQVQAHSQRYSQAVKAQRRDSPWFSNFDAMALKTVIKNLLSKWGILSIELRRALAADQASYLDLDGEPTYIDNGEAREPVPMPQAISVPGPAPTLQPAPREPGDDSDTIDPEALELADNISDLKAKIGAAETTADLQEIGAEMMRLQISLGPENYEQLHRAYSERFNQLNPKPAKAKGKA